NVRLSLFNENCEVEWTPISLDGIDLTGNQDHEKLLRRNNAHLVLHGETSEAWIQDRIRELNNFRLPGARPVQAIYLADPRRDDKESILVRDIGLLEGYLPTTVADAVRPFLDQIVGGKRPEPPTPEASRYASGGAL